MISAANGNRFRLIDAAVSSLRARNGDIAAVHEVKSFISNTMEGTNAERTALSRP